MEPALNAKTANKQASLFFKLLVAITIGLVIVSGLVVWRTGQESVSEIEFRQHAARLASTQNWQALESLASAWQQHHPDSAMSHAALGDAFRMTGKFELAATEYREALVLEPGNSQFLTFLGIVLLETTKFDEASQTCRTATKQFPDHAEAWYCLSLAAAETNSVKEVELSLNKLKELNPPLHATALDVIKNHICQKPGRIQTGLCR
jgi:Tfp pilus assembly protein PilF